jgi:hypothetical protein
VARAHSRNSEGNGEANREAARRQECLNVHNSNISGSVLRPSRLFTTQRRVVVKARVVRHRGCAFRSAPLSAHVAYLESDGVTRGGDKPEHKDLLGAREADVERWTTSMRRSGWRRMIPALSTCDRTIRRRRRSTSSPVGESSHWAQPLRPGLGWHLQDLRYGTYVPSQHGMAVSYLLGLDDYSDKRSDAIWTCMRIAGHACQGRNS